MELLLQWADDLDDLIGMAGIAVAGLGYRLLGFAGLAAAGFGGFAVGLGLGVMVG
jgi:hypothetical protein